MHHELREFMPHGHCYFWTPDILYMHVVSDSAIAVAYFVIPFFILYFFFQKRRDIAFPWVFVLFGSFILACGSTHALGVWTTWVPDYRLEGVVKAITALVSVSTAAFLFPLLPKALALPSPADLARANENLARENVERRRAEDQVRALNRELEARVEERTRALERVNQDLRQFVHVVSHDLREPLRAVSNFTRLLGDRYGDRLDDRGREYVELATDGALRMQVMLRDLLRYATLDAELFDAEPIDLQLLVRRVLADLAPLIEETGAQITVAEEMPTVQSSRTHLSQVLQNLVSNAIKYAGEAKPRIRIEAALVDEDFFELVVVDHGVGIPREHVGRVFEMFQRLHTSEEIPGTGVGLSICKRIVERQGGRIEVQDTEGGGATFRIFLPRHVQSPIRT